MPEHRRVYSSPFPTYKQPHFLRLNGGRREIKSRKRLPEIPRQKAHIIIWDFSYLYSQPLPTHTAFLGCSSCLHISSRAAYMGRSESRGTHTLGTWTGRVFCFLFRYDMYDCMIHEIGHLLLPIYLFTSPHNLLSPPASQIARFGSRFSSYLAVLFFLFSSF